MTNPADDRLVAAGPSDDAVTPADGDIPPGEPAEPAAVAGSRADIETLRARWHEIQSGFVDDPHAAVASADGLVREVLHASALREADTEILRQALRGYRTVLESLLGGGPHHR